MKKGTEKEEKRGGLKGLGPIILSPSITNELHNLSVMTGKETKEQTER